MTGSSPARTMMNSNSPIQRPLAGIRALELAEIWAGPLCGAALADMGAEVIKVESIQRISRGQARPAPGASGYPDGDPGEWPWNRSGNFNAVNRNKRSVTLDLASPRGAGLFRELVSLSDALVSNYAPGVVDRLGIGYEALLALKPDLIVVEMPGYGKSGPYKDFRSMGMAIDAVTGHSSLRGYPDMDLTQISLVHHPDAVAGLTAAFGISAALHYRARTGKGQFIELTQSEAFLPHIGEVFLEYGLTGQSRARRGNSHPLMSPHGCYPALGEDKWVTIAVRDEDEWRAFCRVTGIPGLADDSRFFGVEARVANRQALDTIVADWTSVRDSYETVELLQAAGIPSAPVLDCGADTYSDPHLLERDYFQVVDHPDAGNHLMSGPMWKMAGDPKPRHEPAPGLGEHNNYVLSDILGLSVYDLQGLERSEVIGTSPLPGADMGGVRRVSRT